MAWRIILNSTVALDFRQEDILFQFSVERVVNRFVFLGINFFCIMSGREDGPCVHLPQHWGSLGTSLEPRIVVLNVAKYWKVAASSAGDELCVTLVCSGMCHHADDHPSHQHFRWGCQSMSVSWALQGSLHLTLKSSGMKRVVLLRGVFFFAISRGQTIAIKTHLQNAGRESCMNPVCTSVERPNNCTIQWISE